MLIYKIHISVKKEIAHPALLANYPNKGIDLSILGLVVILTLSVAFNNANGRASAQISSNNLGTQIPVTPLKDAATTSTVMKPSALSIGRTTASSAHATSTGTSSAISSNTECTVIPGPAMTFSEICPNHNNVTGPPNSILAPTQQPSPAASTPSSKEPPLQQPARTINPPLIPPSTTK